MAIEIDHVHHRLTGELHNKADRDVQLFLGSIDKAQLATAVNIAENARAVIEGITQLAVCKKENRSGAVVALTYAKPGYPIYLMQIGSIDAQDPKYTGGKVEKYADFARAKARHLQDNPEHYSSAQNQCLEPDQRSLTSKGEVVPAGGITFEEGLIITVSGFSSQLDEIAAQLIGQFSHLTLVDYHLNPRS